MYIYNEWSLLKIHRTYYKMKIENTGRATQMNISYIGDIGILNNNQSILIIFILYLSLILQVMQKILYLLMMTNTATSPEQVLRLKHEYFFR